LEELQRNLYYNKKKNKAPGNDGLTTELYKALWATWGNDILASINCGIEKGSLSSSQRQAVIRLIRKKDKDSTLIKNWRPISLLNTDTKLFSLCLANRMKKVLPAAISSAQLGFMEGRGIEEGIRLLQYIIDYTTKLQKQGLVATIDFQKAFDSISHNYIHSMLKEMNFPPFV
jgi:hypothetical protein